ncbi:unnamed protein product [Amoebophrya sp. A25]|nr:unnamed protein product [Amoebophrya sp. A25]|eukprot:GSA25T00016090001.1
MSAILQMRPENKVDECFLVEVRGTFELTREQLELRGGDNRQGLQLGKFRIKEGNNVELEMGSNMLVGTVEKLKKPLLIVKKTGQKRNCLRPPKSSRSEQQSGSAAVDGKVAPARTSQFAATGSLGAPGFGGGFGGSNTAFGAGFGGFGEKMEEIFSGDTRSEILEVEAVIRRKAIFTKRPSIFVPPELVEKPVDISKRKKK